MSAYAAQMSRLFSAVTGDDGRPAEPDVKPARSTEIAVAQRIAIYRQAYHARLCAAVEADYPAVAALLGVERFRSYVREYARAVKSYIWDLNLYPIGFAEHIKESCDDVGAVDLARLESAIVQSFWAPDVAPLDPRSLSELTTQQLETTTFIRRPATLILGLRCDANTYLSDFRASHAPLSMRIGPTFVALSRHRNEVVRLPVDTVEYELLTMLHHHVPFGTAVERLSASSQSISEDSISSYLMRWLGAGLFAAV